MGMPANPWNSVGARQHAQDFPSPPAPSLASTSPQSLCPPSGHANNWISLVGIRRKCWRGHVRKPLELCQGTPTCAGFSQPAGPIVGVDLPAKPLSSVGSRQQLDLISRYPAQMLAWACPQTLGTLSGHAYMRRIFPARRPQRMKEPASGKQSQIVDEIAFRMQVCSFVKIPEKKLKNPFFAMFFPF